MTELANCPFCGGEPLLDWACLLRDTYHWVRCTNSECVVLPSGMQCLTKAEAIAAWNRRADSPEIAALKARVGELEGEIAKLERERDLALANLGALKERKRDPDEAFDGGRLG